MGTKRLLPNWLLAYREYTDNTESPDSFHVWTALWTLAGAIQRRVWLNIGHITVYPNLYVVLVAPPGVRKTSAISIGKKMLQELGVPLAPSSITREALIKMMADGEAQEEIGPGTDGKTPLMVTHNSLSLASDEFAVFLGKDNFAMLSMLTDWFDCANDWKYVTKNQGSFNVAGVWFNLIGATTPDSLGEYLPNSAITGGFSSRIIFVTERERRKLVPLPFLTPEQEKLGALLREDLHFIGENFRGEFKLGQSAYLFYVDWYEKNYAEQVATDDRMASYLQRKPLHVMKLALLYHVATKSNMIIDAEDLQKGIALLESVEGRMSEAFNTVGTNPLAPVQAKVFELLVQNPKGLSFSTLMSAFWRYASEKELHVMLETLRQMGVVRTRESVEGTYYYPNGKTEKGDKSDRGLDLVSGGTRGPAMEALPPLPPK